MKTIVKGTLPIVLTVIMFSFTVYAQITNGIDQFFSGNKDILTGKNVAVVCNHTSLLADGTHLVDKLLNQKNVTVKIVFTPEHGLNGKVEAGKKTDNSKVFIDNIPVISLYGKEKKPSGEDLKDIDLIIFDLQDVGARFYTYISTMYYVLESAGENNIPVIILDRPNPLGGLYIDGPLLQEKFKSFVGITEIPITHGMTAGELAKYFVGEKLISGWQKISLTVIKCKNWDRSIPVEFYSKWNPPSPNINSFETALVYPGNCLLEGTNISEGRGTAFPFLQFGAPFINADDVISKLKLLKIEGAEFNNIAFIPADIDEMATNPKFEGQTCFGIKIKITDPLKFEPVKFGVKLLYVLVKLYGKKIKFNNSFDYLAGCPDLRISIIKKTSPEMIFGTWQKEILKFEKTRNNYLLY